MSEESESARLLKDDVYPEGVFVSENFYGSRKNRSSIFLVSILALSIVLNLVQGIGIIIREYTRENVIESVSDLRSNFGIVVPSCETDKRLTPHHSWPEGERGSSRVEPGKPIY
jgi:hypothetical protein